MHNRLLFLSVQWVSRCKVCTSVARSGRRTPIGGTGEWVTWPMTTPGRRKARRLDVLYLVWQTGPQDILLLLLSLPKYSYYPENTLVYFLMSNFDYNEVSFEWDNFTFIHFEGYAAWTHKTTTSPCHAIAIDQSHLFCRNKKTHLLRGNKCCHLLPHQSELKKPFRWTARPEVWWLRCSFLIMF